MARPDQHESPFSRPVALSHVIESHLEKILNSTVFSSADSLRGLLRFVVHETIAGRGEDVKEYSLAVGVLGKGESFDPKADPIVRVQMRRLRDHLARYYAAEGRHDALIIDIPKGRYMPAFHAASAPDAPAVATTQAETLIVGREKEMSALRSAFDSAAAGQGRVLCLAGEPGIGKTTLMEVFLRQLAVDGVPCHVAWGRCSERLVGTDAYLPVMEALEDLLRGGDSVRRLMMDVAPTWYHQIVPLTKQMEAYLPPENRVASPERLKRELVSLLKALARERPIVLFLDDLHWADASTVDALSYAGPRCTADRVLIIGTFRPAELQATNHAFLRVKLELQSHDICREVSVPLLSRAEVDRYLALRFSNHEFPRELAARIHAKTEGNALFMAALVQLLRDRDVIAQADGQWVMAGALDEVEGDLPESVRSVVQKKIGELTEIDRQLLSAAAVLGSQFESAVVARALAMDASEVEERLESLDRVGGFVRSLDERVLPDSTQTLDYGFVHVLYQDALYDALTPTRKTALALGVGEALLAVQGDKAGEVASRLALLFEAGRDFARASDFFLLASVNAGRLYAAEQAIALARQSIANAEHLENRERHSRVLAAALQSGVQQQSLTRFEAAVADFELAERAARALGDPLAQVNAIFGQASACFLAKRIPQVKECGIRAMEIAQACGSAGAVAASTTILAMEGICSGDVTSAERQFDEAIPVLQQSGFIPHALIAVLIRGLLHTWRLEHHESEQALTWARQTAGALQSTYNLMIASWHQARARGNQGRLSDAWEMLEGALRLTDQLGDRFWRPRIENTRGWLLAELGDTEAALRLNTEAVRVAREFGDVEAECNSHINAARDYLVLGEPHNALLHLQQAETQYQGDVWFRWVYYPRLQAEMASYWLARSDLQQAQACARLSLEHAERTSSRKRIAWARKLLGDIALRDEHPGEAAREFRVALAVLEDHPCPMIEWQVLRSAAAAAARLDGDAARRDLLARAGAVVRSIANAIEHAELRGMFLQSEPVRELLSGR